MQNNNRNPLFLSVDVELTNLCRNNCAICPRHALTRPKGFMSTECFDELIHFLTAHKPIITFSGMGDPLLNRNWDYFIIAAKSKGYNVGLNAHPASLKEDDNLKRLGAAKPNRFYLSFPGLDRASFEVINPSISFDEAVEMAEKTALVAKGSFGLTVSGISAGTDVSKEQEFKNMWRKKGIRAHVFKCHSRGGNLADTRFVTGSKAQAETKSRPCSLFMFHTFIAWNGAILACCHDLDGSTKLNCLKNSNPQSLLAIKKKTASSPMPFRICSNCDEPLRYLSLPLDSKLDSITSRKELFRKAYPKGLNQI